MAKIRLSFKMFLPPVVSRRLPGAGLCPALNLYRGRRYAVLLSIKKHLKKI